MLLLSLAVVALLWAVSALVRHFQLYRAVMIDSPSRGKTTILRSLVDFSDESRQEGEKI